MTKYELKQLYYINRGIQRRREKLKRLRSKSLVGVPKLTGTPTGAVVRKKVEDETIEIVATENELRELQKKAYNERRRLVRYINRVDDSLIREIIELKFLNQKSWTAVAVAVGGGNTADSVRKALDRYLEKH